MSKHWSDTPATERVRSEADRRAESQWIAWGRFIPGSTSPRPNYVFWRRMAGLGGGDLRKGL